MVDDSCRTFADFGGDHFSGNFFKRRCCRRDRPRAGHASQRSKTHRHCFRNFSVLVGGPVPQVRVAEGERKARQNGYRHAGEDEGDPGKVRQS